jgi:hypothetical protein
MFVLVLSQEVIHGRYVRPDLVNIPVERLIKNLEAIAEDDPNDAQIRFNLARVHAMAYALKADAFNIFLGLSRDTCKNRT